MAPRTPIIAGQSVIVVQVQDLTNSAFASIEKNFKAFSNRLSRVGFELFSGGLFGSLGVGFVSKQFKDLEDELLFLKTKLQPTEQEFVDITETIRNLGRTTSFTAKQVAEGATILAQAGFKAAEVQQLLLPTLDLARGSQVELSAAGAILANTLRSFSLEASQAGEVASQFTAAARLGTLDVLDLKESIKEVLGTARGLNIDLPTTLGLITQLAERSLKGTKAGTSLNTALLNLASKGKQLANLGIVLPDNINGGDFLKFLEQLQDRLKSFGNVKQVAILQRLFNIRGARAITALDDLKSLTKIIREIKNAGDEARKTAIVMDSGFGGSLRRAQAGALSLGLTLGNVFNKGVEPLLKYVPPLSAAFEKLAIANQELAFGLLITPPILLATGAGLLVAGFAASKFAGLIGLAGFAVRNTGKLIGGVLIKNITLLAIGLNKIKKTAKSIDQGLAGSLLPVILTGGRGRNAKKPKKTSFFGRVGAAPISLTEIGKGGVAGILGIGRLFGNLTKAIINLINSGLTKLLPILKNVTTFFTSIANVVTRVVRQIRLLNTILLSASGIRITGSALGIITQGLRDIGNIISSGFKASFLSVFGLFGKVFTSTARVGVVTFTKSLRGLLQLDIVKGLFNIFSFTGKIAIGFLRAANAVRRFVFSFSGFLTIVELLIIFGPKIDFIRNAFVRLGKGIAEAFSVLGTILTDIQPAFELFSLGFGRIFKGDVEKGLSVIIESLGFMVDIIGIRISAAWNTVLIAIAPAYDMMKKFILATLELANLFGDLFGSTIGKGFTGISDAIRAGFTGGQSLSEIITSVFTAENMKAAFAGIGAFFTGIAETIRSGVSLVVHSIVETMIFLKATIASLLPAIKTLLTATGNGNKMEFIGQALRLNPLTNGIASFFLKNKGADQTKELEKNLADMKSSLDKFDKTMLGVPNQIQNAFEKFSTRLENIFKGDAEAKALEAQQNLFDANNEVAAALEGALQDARGKRRGFGARNLPGLVNVLGSPLASGFVRPQQKSALEQQIEEQQKRLAGRAFGDIGARSAAQELEDQIQKSLRKPDVKGRFRGVAAVQRATLADVAASSVGTFQQTRNNKFGVGDAKDIQTQQLNSLKSIEENTGPTGTFGELVNKATPFVFQ